MNARSGLSEKELILLSAVMDVDSTLKRLGHDIDLFRQIVQIYLEDAPDLLDLCRRSIAGGDAPTLRRAAHSLKGLLATLSSYNAVSAASQLEQLGAAGELTGAQQAMHDLDRRVAEVQAALQAYSEQANHSGQGHAVQAGM